MDRMPWNVDGGHVVIWKQRIIKMEIKWCYNDDRQVILTKVFRNFNKIKFCLDGGSGAHSDRLLTNRDDNNDSKSVRDKYYTNNIAIVPVQFKGIRKHFLKCSIAYQYFSYSHNLS